MNNRPSNALNMLGRMVGNHGHGHSSTWAHSDAIYAEKKIVTLFFSICTKRMKTAAVYSCIGAHLNIRSVWEWKISVYIFSLSLSLSSCCVICSGAVYFPMVNKSTQRFCIMQLFLEMTLNYNHLKESWNCSGHPYQATENHVPRVTLLNATKKKTIIDCFIQKCSFFSFAVKFSTVGW